MIKRNISLKKYTTFKIGGKAKYFSEVQTLKQLKEALKWAQEQRVPIFILGNGSNVLFSDQGFPGLVIKLTNRGIKKLSPNSVLVQAGTLTNEFLNSCVKNNWSGFEWLAGIPGTMGGVVYGNAGAFGHEIKDYVQKVETFDSRTQNFKSYSCHQCHFSYRESIFKRKAEIIWQIELKVIPGNRKEIQEKIAANWRQKIQNHTFDFPSAGSVFKNIIIKNTPYRRYFNKKKGTVKILGQEITVKGGKVSAGWFIEQCGLKGFQIGGAKIADFHGNIIINYKNAKAQDVLKLIQIAKDKVWQKFKIKLEEEIIIA